jgi:hypothetical protein
VKERTDGRGRGVTIGWTNKRDEEAILENGGKAIKI